MAKKDWLILETENSRHILTDVNEASIKSLLLEVYQPYTIIRCLDYNTGELIEELTLNDLYGAK